MKKILIAFLALALLVAIKGVKPTEVFACATCGSCPCEGWADDHDCVVDGNYCKAEYDSCGWHECCSRDEFDNCVAGECCLCGCPGGGGGDDTDYADFNGTVWDGSRDWMHTDSTDCGAALSHEMEVTSSIGEVIWIDRHFDVMDAIKDKNVTLTLTPPSECGYICKEWYLRDAHNNYEVIASGSGCTAEFLMNTGVDWRYNVLFTISPQCTIQGYKQPSSNPTIGGQTVYLEYNPSPGVISYHTTTANPYFFSNITAGDRKVHVSVPSGYKAGYTYCANRTDCHGDPPIYPPISGGQTTPITINCPSGGYADLWWHYTPFQCVGGAPANSTMCSNDNTGLTSDTAVTLVDSCGVPKCEYFCNAYYHRESNICAANTCSTTGIPTNATLCSGDNTSVPTHNLSNVIVPACTSTRKCEYACNAGYAYNSTTGRCEPIPTCSFTVAPSSACETAGSASFTLDASASTNATSFTWTYTREGGGVTTQIRDSSASFTRSFNNSSGTAISQYHDIALSCSGPGGTTAATSRRITVYNRPVASFTLSPEYDSSQLGNQEMDTVEFDASASQFTSTYSWNFGDGTTLSNSPVSTSTHTYNNDSATHQNRTVTLTVSNAGPSCSSSTTGTVCLPSKPVINVPAGGFVPENYVPQLDVHMNDCYDGAVNNRVILFYKKEGTGSYTVVGCSNIGGSETGSGTWSCPLGVSFENNVTYDIWARATNGLISKDSDVEQFTFETRPWYQLGGGGVHADDGGITSELPTNAVNFFTQSGFATRTEENDINLGRFYNPGPVVRTRSGRYEARRFDYSYWRQKFDSDLEVWEGNLPANTNFHIYATGWAIDNENPSESPLVIGPLVVNGSKKFALIHHGDVEIAGNIEIVSGSALLVVASGDIAVDDVVTRIDGFYIANGLIITADDINHISLPLSMQGSFVGWSGIRLNRNLGSSDNINTPAETLVPRIDIANTLRTINQMKVFSYSWREVAP